MSNTPWVIVGTGALGSILGARLLLQKQSVTFVLRNQEEARNLKLTVRGHTEFSDSVKTCSAASLASIPNNAVWVFPVKAWQLETALAAYAPALSTAQHIIVSHNGLGAANKQLSQFAAGQVIDWVTTHGGWRKERFHTEHSGLGQSWLGFRTPTMESNPPNWWSHFSNGLPPSQWETNIALRRWHKLAINCAINPLAALANAANGELQALEYQSDIQAVCNELAAVMNAELNTQVSASDLLTQVQQVITGTANNINSMLQDLRANRPTEIDYLNGFVHKKGRQHNVPTPINTKLWQAIRNR